jgi:hypothetical protein
MQLRVNIVAGPYNLVGELEMQERKKPTTAVVSAYPASSK